MCESSIITKGKRAFTVLVVCPMDVCEEIEVINEAVGNWNENYNCREKCNLKFVHWRTDAFPDSGDRAQALVNEQIVADSDIVVGIFKERFGTNSGAANSGTEEEIRLSLALEKHIMLYVHASFQNMGTNSTSDFGMLNNFLAEYNKHGIYWVYSGLKEFQVIFPQHLKQQIEIILNRIPNAIYQDILQNLKNYCKIYDQCIDFANGVLDEAMLHNVLEIYNGLNPSLTRNLYETESQLGDAEIESGTFFFPVAHRDSVKSIYFELDMLFDRTKGLQEYPDLAANFLMNAKLCMVNIVSLFILTKPTKKYIDSLKCTLENCKAFSDQKEFKKLSFIPGKSGWKINQQYYRELHSLKVQKSIEEALYWKNRVYKNFIQRK